MLGAFCVTLLSSGILSPEALLRPGQDLRIWKKKLLAVHMANAEIGYMEQPVSAPYSALSLLMMSGLPIQHLQYAAGRVVEDFNLALAAN